MYSNKYLHHRCGKVFAFTLIFFTHSLLYCQQYPNVGDEVSTTNLQHVKYYPKKTIPLSRFKGKPVILDFFATGCTVCFTKLPQVDSLRQQFRNRLEIIMVGNEDGRIQKSYEIYQKRYQLSLPVSFDSATFRKFVPSTVPHLVWIKADGTIGALTASWDLTADNIESFLNNKSFIHRDHSASGTDRIGNYFDSVDESRKIAALDTLLLFASILRKSKPGTLPVMPKDIGESLIYSFPNSIQLIGANLVMLYKFAFTGSCAWLPGDSLYAQFYPYPIFKTITELPGGSYDYYLTVPKHMANSIKMQDLLRRELFNSFNLEPRVEKTMVPCLKLIVTDKRLLARLNNNNIKPGFSNSGFSLDKRPVIELIAGLSSFLDYEPPIINLTGITGPISIELELIMNDLTSVRKALKRYGLDLIKSQTPMNAIVF